jgi:Brp/Blh family beta-carotene 15,15'-monooxygenase
VPCGRCSTAGSGISEYWSSIVEADITTITDRRSGVVSTSVGEISAPLVLQSVRLDPSDRDALVRQPLRQHFGGWEVRTDRPVFDPECVTLMDFDAPQHDGTAFFYVLPSSPHRALVEYTMFSEHPRPRGFYDDHIRDHLTTLGADDYAIERSEYGVIPMEDRRHQQRSGNHVWNIGTVGGMSKPTTGYTFKRTHQQVRHLVDTWAASGRPRTAERAAARFGFADRTLLNILHHHPELGRPVFERLFRTSSIDDVLTFLDERSTLAADGRMIAWTSEEALSQSGGVRTVFTGGRSRSGALPVGLITSRSGRRSAERPDANVDTRRAAPQPPIGLTQSSMFRPVAALTAIAAVLAAALPDPDTAVSFAVVAATVILFGIPHGAVDHLVAAEPRRSGDETQTRRFDRRFHMEYVGAMLAVGLVWFLVPAAALFIFLVISVHHFGQSDLAWCLLPMARQLPLQWSRGLLLVGFPLVAHLDTIAPIIDRLRGGRPDQWNWLYDHAIAWCVGLVLQHVVVGVVSCRNMDVAATWIRREVIGVGVIVVLFAVTDPLIGFAVYFGLWHSLGHVLVLRQTLFSRTAKLEQGLG